MRTVLVLLVLLPFIFGQGGDINSGRNTNNGGGDMNTGRKTNDGGDINTGRNTNNGGGGDINTGRNTNNGGGDINTGRNMNTGGGDINTGRNTNNGGGDINTGRNTNNGGGGDINTGRNTNNVSGSINTGRNTNSGGGSINTGRNTNYRDINTGGNTNRGGGNINTGRNTNRGGGNIDTGDNCSGSGCYRGDISTGGNTNRGGGNINTGRNDNSGGGNINTGDNYGYRTSDFPSAEDVEYDCSDFPDGKYPAGQCENIFFECDAGKPVLGMCADEGMRYSFEEDTCLTPINVPGCPEFNGTASPCANRQNGFYQDAEDCTKFLFCVNSIYFSFNCVDGLVYSDDRKRCMPQAEVLAPCGTAQPSEPFTCEGIDDGVYASPMECDTFYRCEDGEKTCEVCQAGYAFDAESKECKMAVTVPGCMPPVEGDLVSFCASKGKDGIFEFPGNCHRATLCIADVPFAFFCSDQDKPDFDQRLLSCVADVPGCD